MPSTPASTSEPLPGTAAGAANTAAVAVQRHASLVMNRRLERV